MSPCSDIHKRLYIYIGDWTDSVLPIVRPNQRRRPMGHGGQLGHQVWHAPQKVLPRDFLLRVKVIFKHNSFPDDIFNSFIPYPAAPA